MLAVVGWNCFLVYYVEMGLADKPILTLALKIVNHQHTLADCGSILDLPTSEVYEKGDTWSFGPPGQHRHRTIRNYLWEYREWLLSKDIGEGVDTFLDKVFFDRHQFFSKLPPGSGMEFYYRYTPTPNERIPSLQLEADLLKLLGRYGIDIDIEYY